MDGEGFPPALLFYEMSKVIKHFFTCLFKKLIVISDCSPATGIGKYLFVIVSQTPLGNTGVRRANS